jgi:STE24 endopeptidase
MTDIFSTIPPHLSVSILFSITLILTLVLKFWLSTRQVRHVAAHRGTVPSAFANTIPLSAHQKAADYTLEKSRVALLELAWGAVVTIGWTLLGGLSFLNQLLAGYFENSLIQQVSLIVVFLIVNGVIDLPFTLYQTFVVEQRFGFNKTSLRLWIQDFGKSSVLSAVIGLPLVALVIWMMGTTGTWWWLWTWCVWMTFNLLMVLIYPTWIAPWFNHFKPLQDAVLMNRVTALMQRCGFTSNGFFIMDGSRRSAHANAYFTGFGASKRVVFYDTLIAQLTPDEIDAVLAHELGHFKHNHLLKRMVPMFALSLVGFGVLGWISQKSWFFTGLGVAPNLLTPNDAIALLLFMMVLPLMGTFVGPLFAQVSRRHEFEADAYAVMQTSGTAMASALLKLYKDNASTLTPDPIYVNFYYSHPQASERLGRMLSTPT